MVSVAWPSPPELSLEFTCLSGLVALHCLSFLDSAQLADHLERGMPQVLVPPRQLKLFFETHWLLWVYALSFMKTIYMYMYVHKYVRSCVCTYVHWAQTFGRILVSKGIQVRVQSLVEALT